MYCEHVRFEARASDTQMLAPLTRVHDMLLVTQTQMFTYTTLQHKQASLKNYLMTATHGTLEKGKDSEKSTHLIPIALHQFLPSLLF